VSTTAPVVHRNPVEVGSDLIELAPGENAGRRVTGSDSSRAEHRKRDHAGMDPCWPSDLLTTITCLVASFFLSALARARRSRPLRCICRSFHPPSQPLLGAHPMRSRRLGEDDGIVPRGRAKRRRGTP